jgi:hypothetical protein
MFLKHCSQIHIFGLYIFFQRFAKKSKAQNVLEYIILDHKVIEFSLSSTEQVDISMINPTLILPGLV